jgi:tetratricopeptide (TPR) repeat protein
LLLDGAQRNLRLAMVPALQISTEEEGEEAVWWRKQIRRSSADFENPGRATQGEDSATVSYLSYYLGYWVFQRLASGDVDLLHLALVAGIFLTVRRWLPSPYLFFKHRRTVSRLRTEIGQNAENVTARRDLAKIWLEKRRPRRALVLIEEAMRRDPDSIELHFLRGKTQAMLGHHELALEELVKVASMDERFAYGEVYRLAGHSLLKLGRRHEAADAFERHLAINSSSVEAHVLLARCQLGLGEAANAKRSIAEALATYRALPGYRRRAEFGWYVRARTGLIGT